MQAWKKGTLWLFAIALLLIKNDPTYAQFQTFDISETNIYGGYQAYPLYLNANDTLTIIANSTDALALRLVAPDNTAIAEFRDGEEKTITIVLAAEYTLQVYWEAFTTHTETVIEGCNDNVNCSQTNIQVQEDNPASYTIRVSIITASATTFSASPTPLPATPTINATSTTDPRFSGFVAIDQTTPDASNTNSSQSPAQQANEVRMAGDQAFAIGEYEIAESKYREALALNPRNDRAMYGLAKLAIVAEDYEGAITLLETALSMSADDPLYHYELAKIYLQLGDDATALNSLNQALSQGTNLNGGWMERAGIHFRMGNGEQALADYQQAREEGLLFSALDSYQYAILLEIEGKFDLAGGYYQNAIMLEPQNKDYAMAISRILPLLTNSRSNVTIDAQNIQIRHSTGILSFQVPNDLTLTPLPLYFWWSITPFETFVSFDETPENESNRFVATQAINAQTDSPELTISAYILLTNEDKSPFDFLTTHFSASELTVNERSAITGQIKAVHLNNFTGTQLVGIELPNGDALVLQAIVKNGDLDMSETLLEIAETLQIQEDTSTIAANAEFVITGLFAGDMAINTYLCPQEQLTEEEAKIFQDTPVTITALSCTNAGEEIQCQVTIVNDGKTISSGFTFHLENDLICGGA